MVKIKMIEVTLVDIICFYFKMREKKIHLAE